MSFPLLPIIAEAVPLILSALSVGVGLTSLRNRFQAEDTLVKEIESHKEEFEKEYLKYRLAKSSEERELELDEIRDRIKNLLEKTGRENTKLLSAALFQSSLKGRNSYLKKLLSEAHVIEKAVNKKNQADT